MVSPLQVLFRTKPLSFKTKQNSVTFKLHILKTVMIIISLHALDSRKRHMLKRSEVKW